MEALREGWLAKVDDPTAAPSLHLILVNEQVWRAGTRQTHSRSDARCRRSFY